MAQNRIFGCKISAALPRESVLPKSLLLGEKTNLSEPQNTPDSKEFLFLPFPTEDIKINGIWIMKYISMLVCVQTLDMKLNRRKEVESAQLSHYSCSLTSSIFILKLSYYARRLSNPFVFLLDAEIKQKLHD